MTIPLAHHSESAIQTFETLGIQVYVTRNEHHHKLAILDRQILWEGSLNILSQTKSREIMQDWVCNMRKKCLIFCNGVRVFDKQETNDKFNQLHHFWAGYRNNAQYLKKQLIQKQPAKMQLFTWRNISRSHTGWREIVEVEQGETD